jgi:hypothetical protein
MQAASDIRMSTDRTMDAPLLDMGHLRTGRFRIPRRGNERSWEDAPGRAGRSRH